MYDICRNALLFVFFIIGLARAAPPVQENFVESVVVRELDQSHILYSFKFDSTGTTSPHHTTFPPSISELLDTYPIDFFRLSLTRGRWMDQTWGLPRGGAPAPGAQLEVVWQPHVRPQDVPSLWTGFTNAVSGLFCTSLNFLAAPETVVSARLRFPWDTESSSASIDVSRAALANASHAEQSMGSMSQEAVCTENLTAWLKLLPCKDRAGFAALLSRRAVFGSRFHSIQVEARVDASGAAVLRQRLLLVSQSSAAGQNSSGDILPARDFTACPAASSSLLVALHGGAGGRHVAVQVPEMERRCGQGDVSVAGTQRHFTQCQLRAARAAQLEVTWSSLRSEPPSPPAQKPSLPAALAYASQHMFGAGDERALWRLEVRRLPSDAGALSVCTFSTFPWFLQLWLHSLEYFVDGRRVRWDEVGVWQEVRPGEARRAMHTLEMCMRLPEDATTLAVSADITKTLLYVHEYPPDPHRGFDVPAARVLVQPAGGAFTPPALAACRLRGATPSQDDATSDQDATSLASLLCGIPSPQYTVHSVVSLATPDFSMPYNVCCLSSTLLAVFFGAMLNLLTGRQRIMALRARSKSARVKKLGVIALMSCGFVFLAVYLDADLQNWVVGELKKFGYAHDSLF